MRELVTKLVSYLRHMDRDGPERDGQRARNVRRIQLLERFIVPGGTAAELGVHKGYFSHSLLRHLAPKKLYLIDPWYLQGTKWSWGEGNRRVVDALCRIMRELEDDLASGKLVLCIADDIVALNQFPDRHFDWVYLDTTHQYNHTKYELCLLKQKVRSGGIIAGDDWQVDPSHRHHGVCRAVREFVAAQHGSLLHADADSMQWIVKLK